MLYAIEDRKNKTVQTKSNVILLYRGDVRWNKRQQII